MSPTKQIKHDEIGCWSEIKLDIIKEYASAYSRILSSQRTPSFHHVYIDGFAGTGQHRSKETGEPISGSPLNALSLDPPFNEYYFIDLDGQKVAELKRYEDERPNVHIYEGDCNIILLNEIFPLIKWEDYKRALCLLDPYGLHLKWDVLKKASEMGTIEIFFNFSIMDANMNILWHDPKGVSTDQVARMNECWGDGSWKDIAYDTSGNLFGWPEKTDNRVIAEAFQERLKKVAGFGYVPKPIPMRNSNGAVIYYLYFASHKPVADEIVKQIFDKYRNRGVKDDF